MSKILMVILGWFTQDLLTTVFKCIFSGFIGLASYQFIKLLIDKYITATVSRLNAIGDLSAMLNLSGFDVAISVMLSACVIRASILALGLVVTKGSS